MVTRIILAVIGAVLLLVGAAAGVAAGWGYTSIGTDGLVTLSAGTISPGPQAQAVVIDVDTFTVTAPYVGGLGRSSLVATSPTAGADLFLGAAATPDANDYLAGVPYAVAFRDGGGWAVREVPGGVAPPAASSGTWLEQASGPAPAIAVPTARPLSLVITSAAGAPLAPIDLSVAFSIPDISTWLLVLAIAAGVLVILGIVLLFLAFRRRTPMGKHAAGQVVPVEDAVTDDEASAVDPVVDDTATVTDATVTGATDGAATDETTELPVVVETEPEPEEPVAGVVYVIDPDEEAGTAADVAPATDEPVVDESEQEAGDERN